MNSTLGAFGRASACANAEMPASIKQFGHKLVDAFEQRENTVRLPPGKHRRKIFPPFGSDSVNILQLHLKDMFLKIHNGIQSLVLGRGSDLLFDRQKSQVLRDLLFPHRSGMSFIVEENKAPDPVEIGFFRAAGIILLAQRVPNPYQQLWFLFRHRIDNPFV
jgi:hypothetical protein